MSQDPLRIHPIVEVEMKEKKTFVLKNLLNIRGVSIVDLSYVDILFRIQLSVHVRPIDVDILIDQLTHR
jgi:hypothetical protein